MARRTACRQTAACRTAAAVGIRMPSAAAGAKATDRLRGQAGRVVRLSGSGQTDETGLTDGRTGGRAFRREVKAEAAAEQQIVERNLNRYNRTLKPPAPTGCCYVGHEAVDLSPRSSGAGHGPGGNGRTTVAIVMSIS